MRNRVDRLACIGEALDNAFHLGLSEDLIMANQIGLTGLLIFMLVMAGVLAYGARTWKSAMGHPEYAAIHLGFHAALVTGLVNAVADLYFFRLDFQSSITWFWLIVALCIASSRLVRESEPDPS